jgi:hypothetical protein
VFFIGGSIAHNADLKTSPDCNVCAVGAVLRKRVSKDMLLSDFRVFCDEMTQGSFCSDDDLEEALENKNYLGALSIKFEQLNDYDYVDDRPPMLEIREKMIEFVTKNFPESFEASDEEI